MSFALNENEIQTYRRYAELNLPRHTSYPLAASRGTLRRNFQAKSHLGSVLVVDENDQLLGIFTDTDGLRILADTLRQK